MITFKNDRNEESSILNSININSNIRAPGEYKYTYYGDNAAETDKSFFNFSTMWYTTKITSEHSYLCTTYNIEHTVMLYYNKKDKFLNLFWYKNDLNVFNENFSLSEKGQIDIPVTSRTAPNIKIFLIADNHVLINEIDLRIILLDLLTGNFITLFEKIDNDKFQPINVKDYNVIDTFDELYRNTKDQLHRCSYIFIYSKDKSSKSFAYYYFIFSFDDFDADNTISLIPLDFGPETLCNAEPFGLKIFMVSSEDNKSKKWYYVFNLVMRDYYFQFVSEAQRVSLNNILYNYCAFKHNKLVTEIKTKLNEGSQSSKKLSIFLYHSHSNVSCIILLLESGTLLTFPFYTTYSSKEILKAIKPTSNMLFIDSQMKGEFKNNPNNISLIKNSELGKFSPEIYCFPVSFLSVRDCRSAKFSYQNLILAIKDTVFFYKRGHPFPRYQYNFYEEKLAKIISFYPCNVSFVLTGNKLFKIIYNESFDKYYDNAITANVPLFSHSTMQYPVFELSPEILFQRYDQVLNSFENNKENEDEEEYQDEKGPCEICGLESTDKCSECGKTFYCSIEHYKLYYKNFHFFDCILSKLFKHQDLFTDPNAEDRYIKLYNLIIKTFGNLLNHIFKRIKSCKDYQMFLQFIVLMIKLMNNFSFDKNMEEFNFNYSIKNEIPEERSIKTLFYIEAIFFYLQLNLLKCTITMKSRLYNLTECYLKIFKSDLMPLLSKKKNTKTIMLNYKKYEGSKYVLFNFFFNVKRIFNTKNEIDLTEIYLILNLYCQSLLVKYKIKINSLIDIKETFVDISLMIESQFSDSKMKNIVPYCFFTISFYLVETGKIDATIKLLKRMISSFTEKADNKLKALTFYNLGVLKYALGEFKLGVHNLEMSYKLIVDSKLSTLLLLSVLDSLSLAYLNQKNLFKAYIMIKTSLNERTKIESPENELQSIKLNYYLNYIIDLFEYSFIIDTKRILTKPVQDDINNQLIQFVLENNEKVYLVSEQYFESFIKSVRFFYNLKNELLSILHQHNPAKQILFKEESHHDRLNGTNMDSIVSYNSVLGGKENGADKDQNYDEYEEDIEIKPTFFDLLKRKDQNILKTFKESYLKRDSILRDSLGIIEPFNINYHPIYSEELMTIINTTRSNFLLKKVFYCFQNEKWREEYYNYEADYCLYGLSKYIQSEKIKTMIIVEKSKKSEFANKIKEVKVKRGSITEIQTEEINGPRLSLQTTNDNSLEQFNDFKEKFKEIKQKHKELKDYFDFKEEDLFLIYRNLGEMNKDTDYFINNPLILLNYIYTDLMQQENSAYSKKNKKKKDLGKIRSQSCVLTPEFIGQANINCNKESKKERKMSLEEIKANLIKEEEDSKSISSKVSKYNNHKSLHWTSFSYSLIPDNKILVPIQLINKDKSKTQNKLAKIDDKRYTLTLASYALDSHNLKHSGLKGNRSHQTLKCDRYTRALNSNAQNKTKEDIYLNLSNDLYHPSNSSNKKIKSSSRMISDSSRLRKRSKDSNKIKLKHNKLVVEKSFNVDNDKEVHHISNATLFTNLKSQLKTTKRNNNPYSLSRTPFSSTNDRGISSNNLSVSSSMDFNREQLVRILLYQKKMKNKEKTIKDNTTNNEINIFNDVEMKTPSSLFRIQKQRSAQSELLIKANPSNNQYNKSRRVSNDKKLSSIQFQHITNNYKSKLVKDSSSIQPEGSFRKVEDCMNDFLQDINFSNLHSKSKMFNEDIEYPKDIENKRNNELIDKDNGSLYSNENQISEEGKGNRPRNSISLTHWFSNKTKDRRSTLTYINRNHIFEYETKRYSLDLSNNPYKNSQINNSIHIPMIDLAKQGSLEETMPIITSNKKEIDVNIFPEPKQIKGQFQSNRIVINTESVVKELFPNQKSNNCNNKTQATMPKHQQLYHFSKCPFIKINKDKNILQTEAKLINHEKIKKKEEEHTKTQITSNCTQHAKQRFYSKKVLEQNDRNYPPQSQFNEENQCNVGVYQSLKNDNKSNQLVKTLCEPPLYTQHKKNKEDSYYEINNEDNYYIQQPQITIQLNDNKNHRRSSIQPNEYQIDNQCIDIIQNNPLMISEMQQITYHNQVEHIYLMNKEDNELVSQSIELELNHKNNRDNNKYITESQTKTKQFNQLEMAQSVNIEINSSISSQANLCDEDKQYSRVSPNVITQNQLYQKQLEISSEHNMALNYCFGEKYNKSKQHTFTKSENDFKKEPSCIDKKNINQGINNSPTEINNSIKETLEVPSFPVIPPISAPPSIPGIPSIPGVPSIPGTVSIQGFPSIMPMPIPSLLSSQIKKKQQPKVSMKPLFWSTLNANNIQNTCWQGMDDESIIKSIDLSKLENEFSNKKQAATKQTENKALFPQEQSVLQPGRRQNISMIFAKLKKKPEEIAQALLTYDEFILNVDTCDIIYSILPKEEEINNIKSIEDLSGYTSCDKFVYLIANIPGFEFRVKSMQIRYSFPEVIAKIQHKIETLRTAVDTFKADCRINEWLKIILAFGNYLNGATNRGGAYGFKLETLNKIVDLKSNDNKKSLLTFIIEWIYDNSDKALLEVNMSYLKDASLTSLYEMFKETKQSLSEVEKLKSMTLDVNKEIDKTELFINSFYHEALKKVDQAEQEINSINEEYESLVLFFGETLKDMSFEKLINVFRNFFDNVNKMTTTMIRQRELTKKNK